ncbi:hypothetical protein [Cellulomonas dongxiuzhuiae]|uniref:hypothetical protein n=1 Tax=Cellulomonas dongxiuzhuiae TaxID=2819979 RepID=UPI001AAE5CCA|nr:hypothetical protein [Cellulomonas dongxiuzhuiae]MBO3086972.1 hypothetical protein [Cellulomonas dongxiuzhuiae]
MPRSTLLALAAATLLGLGLVTGCTTSTAPPAAPSGSTATPTPTPGESLLTDDIADGTAVGTLAPSFPADLVPVPPDAEVLVSSAEPAGDATLRISLNVRTGQDTAGLVEAVRAPLLAAGFTESAPPAVEAGLAAQTTFSRSAGSELLVVGVLDRDGMRTMTLGGTVAAPAP